MNTPHRRLGDRRLKRRFEIVGQLWGALETIESLRIRNVGPAGALLESRFALAVDSVHRVRLDIEGQWCDVQARVRHVEQLQGSAPRFLIGLEFLAPPEAAAVHLQELMGSGAAPPGEPS